MKKIPFFFLAVFFFYAYPSRSQQIDAMRQIRWPNEVYCLPGLTIKQCIATLPSGGVNGGVIRLSIGVWRSGYENPTPGQAAPWPNYLSYPNITILGDKSPQYASDRKSFVAGSGSIIQGSFYAANISNLTIAHVGFDTGKTFVDANYGGQADNSLVITNPTYSAASINNNIIIDDVACLNYSATSAYHCLLEESINGGSTSHVRTVYATYGLVIKGNHVTVNDLDARGHSSSPFIIKSETYGVVESVTASNIKSATVAAGDTGGIVIQAASAPLNNVALFNFSENGTTIGNEIVSTDLLSNVTIGNGVINYGGSAGSPSPGYCLGADGASIINFVTYANITCSNYTNGLVNTQVLRNSSASGLQFNNITGGNIVSGFPLQIVNMTMTGTTGNQFTSSTAGSVTYVSGYTCSAGCTGSLTSVAGGAIVNVAPNPGLFTQDTAGNSHLSGTLYADSNIYGPTSGAVTIRGGAGSANSLVVQDNAGANNNAIFSESGDITARNNIINGANTIYRCTTAGTLPIGALTVDATKCGATADTGFRSK